MKGLPYRSSVLFHSTLYLMVWLFSLHSFTAKGKGKQKNKKRTVALVIEAGARREENTHTHTHIQRDPHPIERDSACQEMQLYISMHGHLCKKQRKKKKRGSLYLLSSLLACFSGLSFVLFDWGSTYY